MNSGNRSDANTGQDRVSHALIKACSIEIAAQTALLWLVIGPIAVLIFPSALLSLGAFAIANLIGSVWPRFADFGGWVQEQWWAILLIIAFAILFFCTMTVLS